MSTILRSALAVAGVAIAAQASAQVTFYEGEGFQGRSFTAEQQIENLARYGFNDRASSAVVLGDRWEVCEDVRFGGRCTVLRPGRYPSLAAMGLDDRVSSVRAASDNARIENGSAPGRVTFYEGENFQGWSFTAEQPIESLARYGFNDRASSAVVLGDQWQVCEDVRFGGRCAVLRPGRYPSLAAMGLDDRVSSARAASDNARIEDGSAPGRVTFYEGEGFQGRSFTAEQPIESLERYGFNDRASSAVVLGDRWQVCEDARFGGRCAVLRPGRYPSLAAMGLDDRVSSARAASGNARIENDRSAPARPGNSQYGRRDGERLYEVNVTSVHAVVATPEQKCWIEHEPVAQERSSANVPGAIAGAVIGGILGHQVGNGRGNDIATVGGAVAGAAVGANVGRDAGGQQGQTRDVQRCTSAPDQARTEYWDVTYDFRGQEHRVQMTTPPGRTLTVNDHGEPRV